MRVLNIHTADHDALDKAVASLKKSLKPGDILLTGPVPKNIITKYFNVSLMLTRRVLRGITHSCMYLDNDTVLDIDYKILRTGTHIEELTLEEFVKGKMDYFGGATIYVVKPRYYSRIQRRLAVLESRENFIAEKNNLTHTLRGSVVVGFRYIFQRKSKFKEDLSFQKDWTCGHMVAYILKKSNVNIGKRASYTFVPPMFAYSKYFKVEQKVVLK